MLIMTCPILWQPCHTMFHLEHCRQSLLLLCTINMSGERRLLNFRHADANNREWEEYNPDVQLLTPNILARHGYPNETSTIRTNDGYLLKIHRISRGRNRNFDPTRIRPVVFLQHGLFCSSADWVLLGPKNSLAFMLADKGYDVWMGNCRGNIYSTHSYLERRSEDFWKFSWHDMAEHDLPAVIDYILNETQQESLIYVGHSMGTAMFFALMSTNPDYRHKIRLMVALAPVAYLSDMTGPLRYIAKIVNWFPCLVRLFGKFEFLPQGDNLKSMVRFLCSSGEVYKMILAAILAVHVGYDSSHIEERNKPVILSHLLAGTSTKTVMHYVGHVNSGHFSKFNSEGSTPYPLEEIHVQIEAFYADNDCFVSSKDLEKLLNRLPSKRRHRVQCSHFNHFDFLYASSARQLVYEDVIQVIQEAWPIN